MFFQRLSLISASFIGVFLTHAAYGATYNVTTSADNVSSPPAGSLRAAINYANSNPPTTITFNSGIDVLLAGPLPTITTSGVTLTGNADLSTTINGQNLYPIFTAAFADTEAHGAYLTLFDINFLNGTGSSLDSTATSFGQGATVVLNMADQTPGLGPLTFTGLSPTLDFRQAGSGIFTLSNNINIASGTMFTLYLKLEEYQVLSGQISGAGTFQTSFTEGVLILSNPANDFTGGLLIVGEAFVSPVTPACLGPLNTITFGAVGGGLYTTSSMSIPNALVFGVPGYGVVAYFTETMGTTSTFTGPISGTTAQFMQIGDITYPPGNNNGELLYPGGGTLFLDPTSGSNSFSVPNIVIYNGILKIPSQAALGTCSLITFGGRSNQFAGLEFSNSLTFNLPTLTISGYSGSIIADAGTTSTVNSSIGGTGMLGIPGPGKIILPGASNSYSGGTLLTGGILEILNNSVLGSGNLMFNGGALELGAAVISSRPLFFIGPGTIIADTGTSTFSGNFTGTGSLTLPGPGSLNLSGNNSDYSGEIFINGGSVLVASINNLGTGGLSFDSGSLEIMGPGIDDIYPITLAGTGTIITDSGSVNTFNAGITGPGNFIKTGPGSLNLTGMSTYTGFTTIEQGILYVNGSVSNAITVLSGATLGGGGAAGNLDIFGTLSPGNSIGTFTADNVIFESGSTYYVELIGSTSDLLIANGNVLIDSGSTLNVCPSMLTASIYPIIESKGSVAGQFTSLANSCVRYNFVVEYFPQEVLLSFVGYIPFPDLLPSGNLQNIAECFQPLTMNPTDPDMITLLNVLDTLSMSAMFDAFNQFDPSLFNSIKFAEESVATNIRYLYTDRFHQVSDPCENSHLTFWSALFGDEAYQQKAGSTTALSGYKDQFIGGVFALDYHPYPNLLLSSGLGYAYGDIKWRGANAKGYMNSGTVSIAAALQKYNLQLEGYFSVSYNVAKATREIYIAPIQMGNTPVPPPIVRSIDHWEHSLTYTSNLGVSYDLMESPLYSGTFCASPFITLDYIYLDQFFYREKGGISLDLSVNRKGTDLLRPEAGFWLSYLENKGRFTFSSDVSLSYVGEYRMSGKSTRASFIANPYCTFTVLGRLPSNSLFSPFIQVGVKEIFYGLSIYVNYRGFYNKHYQESKGTLEVSFVW